MFQNAFANFIASDLKRVIRDTKYLHVFNTDIYFKMNPNITNFMNCSFGTKSTIYSINAMYIMFKTI